MIIEEDLRYIYVSVIRGFKNQPHLVVYNISALLTDETIYERPQDFSQERAKLNFFSVLSQFFHSIIAFIFFSFYFVGFIQEGSK